MIAALIASILVTFPAENQKLPVTDRTYVIGAAETNRKERLYLNGVEVAVYRTGAFLAMVRTSPGTNTIEFVQGTNTLVRRFTVAAPEKVKVNASAVKVEPSRPRNPYEDLGIPTNAVFAAKPPRGTRLSDIHVMVDAGHGGKDSGALSPRGFKEKDFNLKQALSLEAELRKAGFKVTLTRGDDAFPPLYDRPRRAVREKADLFISIHHNATGVGGNPREARHCVTYASNDAGLALARAVQRQVAQAVAPVKDNGAQLKSLAVCRNPAVPSCLVEVDFINLPEGEEASMDPARCRNVSRAIVMGVLDWLAE
ncbi:MAG: N-acetylmuramoyl-L-alanine amidase [Kiritimatiellae bacterium]|nr:N-acetylmuramoyl-L-alanine amidase [Kiritimatiellia bacterium]